MFMENKSYEMRNDTENTKQSKWYNTVKSIKYFKFESYCSRSSLNNDSSCATLCKVVSGMNLLVMECGLLVVVWGLMLLPVLVDMKEFMLSALGSLLPV